MIAPNTPAPASWLSFAVAVDALGPAWGWFAKIIKIGAIIGLTSVILVLMYGQTRIFYTMARDGLLPKVFGKVHKRFRTPYWATIVVGVIAASLAGLVPLNVLGELVSMGTLLAFATVCVGVLILRYTRPELPRPFRVPLVWVICPLGALFSLDLAQTIATNRARAAYGIPSNQPVSAAQIAEFYDRSPSRSLPIGSLDGAPLEARLVVALDDMPEVLVDGDRFAIVADRIEEMQLYAFDLTDGAVLEKGHCYIVPLMESLDLPAEDKQRLREMTPGRYTGLAERLARNI